PDTRRWVRQERQGVPGPAHVSHWDRDIGHCNRACPITTWPPDPYPPRLGGRHAIRLQAVRRRLLLRTDLSPGYGRAHKACPGLLPTAGTRWVHDLHSHLEESADVWARSKAGRRLVRERTRPADVFLRCSVGRAGVRSIWVDRVLRD